MPERLAPSLGPRRASAAEAPETRLPRGRVYALRISKGFKRPRVQHTPRTTTHRTSNEHIAMEHRVVSAQHNPQTTVKDLACSEASRQPRRRLATSGVQASPTLVNACEKKITPPGPPWASLWLCCALLVSSLWGAETRSSQKWGWLRSPIPDSSAIVPRYVADSNTLPGGFPPNKYE